MTSPNKPRGVHLTGSVGLADAEEVFRQVGSILGDRLRRVPDGETGERSGWISWLMPLFADNPLFEQALAQRGLGPGDYGDRPTYRLRTEVDARDLTFGRLGYADAAKSSYTVFSRLRDQGVLPRGCRFQVSLPTPLAPTSSFVAPESQGAVEPVYETRLLEELAEIVDSVPTDDLAVQWDVAREFAILEGISRTPIINPRDEILRRLVRLGEEVPTGVELGYHLCYGDLGHRHFKEPEDTSVLVDVANALCSRVIRPVNWIHLPVPRDRTDQVYFAPLENLKLKPETELYLGLVHFTDGEEGTRRRIDAASRVVEQFGVATECGMGRRPPDTITALLRIHAGVADPV